MRRGPDGRYISATPGVVPGKRSISVSAGTFRRLKKRAAKDGVTMVEIVEEAVAPVLNPPPPPIPFWLLPTGPIRKQYRTRRRRG